MADMVNAATDASSIARGTAVNRRGFMRNCALVPVAGVLAEGVVANAAAGTRVNTYKGKYAIDGHRIVDGFFASPRGGSKLDMVVVIPANGSLDGAAEATARGYAANGYLAIAPNLPATYQGAALFGKSAMVAALMRDMPRLKKVARGSGRVSVVAA